MKRISVFIRRQRIKKLERWIMFAIPAEAFLLALFPGAAAAAAVIGFVAWFLRLQIDNRFKLRSLPFDVPVSIFIMFGAVSVFLSPARNFELIYNYCGLVGLYGLSYTLVGQNIRTPEQIIKFSKALAASAFFVVMCGYFQYIFGVDIADMKWVDGEAFPELRKRIFSTLENPNILAGYLDVMICLALGLLAKVGGRTQKTIFIVAIIMLTACLAMTYSRGAFLTMAIVFFVYGVLQDWRILILFAGLTAVTAYGDPTFLHRILSIFTESVDSSEGLRVGIWVSTISMIADHPFAGIGWGAYKLVYPQYNYYLADPDILIYHAHNLYLNTAAEVGIVGALAYFWYFFGTMFMSLELGANERYIKLKNQTKEKTLSAFQVRLVNVFMTSKLLQILAQSKSMLLTRMSDLTNRLMDYFSAAPTEEDLRKAEEEEKLSEKKSEGELVHHEELKWSSPPASKKKSDDNDDDKMDLQRFAAEENLFAGNRKFVLHMPKEEIIAGLKLGIGLAFLSMALNGMSDDLLFNIPSSILMWQLGALGASINLLDKE